MHTTRQDFIAHLEGSSLLASVTPLAGPEDLAKKRVELPAAFVAYASGSLKRKEAAQLHLFVPGFSQLADADDAATDALRLTEDLTAWLKENWNWQSERGRTYQIPLETDGGGLDVSAGRFRDQHAFYLVTVPVHEL
jgi:hypothetical protein